MVKPLAAGSLKIAPVTLFGPVFVTRTVYTVDVPEVTLFTPSFLVMERSADKAGVTGVFVGGGFGVFVGGGKYINVFVGLGSTPVFVEEIMAVGMKVFVTSGVFVGRDVTGALVRNDAPGVRKTLIHTGCVRMEGSRGSRKPLGRLVRKALSGSMLDPISVSIFQVGEKRIAHPPARITQRNPMSKMTRMMIQSRLFLSGAFSRSAILNSYPFTGRSIKTVVPGFVASL